MFHRLLLSVLSILTCLLTYSQVCKDTFYHQKLVYPDSEEIDAIAVGPANQIFGVGLSTGITRPHRGKVLQMNEDGSIAWSKIYFTGAESNNAYTLFHRTLYSIDNHLIVAATVAHTTSTTRLIISKMTLSGIPVWTKMFPYGYFYDDIRQSQDGSIIYAINSHFDVGTKDLVGKLDLNGNQLWCKAINTPRPNASFLIHPGPTLLIKGNDIFLSTTIPGLNYMPEPRTTSHIFRLNPANGNVMWEKSMGGSDFDITITSIAALNGLLYYQFRWDTYPFTPTTRFGRLAIDTNGNFRNIMYFTSSSSNTETWFRFSNEDPFIAGNPFSNNDSTIVLVHVNPNGEIDWKNKYRLSLAVGRVISIQKAKKGGWFVNSLHHVNNNAYGASVISKISEDGKLPACLIDNVDISSATMTLPSATGNHTLTDTTIAVVDRSLFNQNLAHTIVKVCSDNTICSTINLQGLSTICNFSDTASYTVARNPGCVMKVKWQFDTSFVSFAETTDSTARFVFKKNGNFQLISGFYSNCVVADTALVDINTSPAGIDLGRDTTLCPGNSLLLNARKGFISYVWQDGSTDSTFLATSGGTFHVEAITACGIIVRDTIAITPSANASIDLGPDMAKCNNDTLLLIGPNGFISYSWSPAYNISQLSGQSTLVFPGIDTTYKLTAEVSPGCFGSDSVRITVNHSQQINLGADTQICYGDSLLLNAGSSFGLYQWNTGETGQSFFAHAAGTYSVSAYNFNGCNSRDTIVLVVSRPQVDINDVQSICSGSVLGLVNAPVFPSYLWNTGSTTNAIGIYQPGTYWIQISDATGCKASDTIQIATVWAPPSGFLQADTSICRSLTLQLQPTSAFNNYLWNNGSTAPSITIDQPGIYWLQVADDNCIGKDSILIDMKECYKGFFIPTAFTPNKDGRNDIFRPLLFGNVIRYKFSIHNRWGEKVFETTDLQKGWDGNLGGKNQDSNVFVWYCSFQNLNEQPEFHKGTVLLVR